MYLGGRDLGDRRRRKNGSARHNIQASKAPAACGARSIPATQRRKFMSIRAVISVAAVAALGIAFVSADAFAARVAARGGSVGVRGGAVGVRSGAVGVRGAAIGYR